MKTNYKIFRISISNKYLLNTEYPDKKMNKKIRLTNEFLFKNKKLFKNITLEWNRKSKLEILLNKEDE